jgi:hypothetical protein
MPGRSAKLLAAVAAFPFLPFGSLSSLAQDGTLGNQGADAKRRARRRERRYAERLVLVRYAVSGFAKRLTVIRKT